MPSNGDEQRATDAVVPPPTRGADDSPSGGTDEKKKGSPTTPQAVKRSGSMRSAGGMIAEAMSGGASAKDEKDQKKGAGGAVFADADAIRAKMHENLDKKDYDVMDYYYEDGYTQAIARSNRFGNLTLTVIAVNALWIGFDAECNDATYAGELTGCPFKPEDTSFWLAGENSFCAFFTFELLVRFGAFKEKLRAFKDNWFNFDSVLVGFMVLETWFMPLIGGNAAMGDFALLRMMRLLRLTRMVRLMRSVPELLTLLKGMGIAARSVAYTLLLLLIIMYVFGIVFKSQLAEPEDPELQGYFDNIPRSMWTLLFAGCLVDDINSIAEAVLAENWMMGMFFLLFVLIASLMVLNMLVGVLCAVVTAVAAAEKEKVLISFVKTRLIGVLQTLDEDGNGTISKTEFDQLLAIPEAVQALIDLGVDVNNLLSLADHLFDPDEGDEDKKDGKANPPADIDPELLALAQLSPEEQKKLDAEEQRSMTFADFLEMVIRLRSDNQPSVADVVDIRKLIYKGQRQATKRLHHLEKGRDRKSVV